MRAHLSPAVRAAGSGGPGRGGRGTCSARARPAVSPVRASYVGAASPRSEVRAGSRAGAEGQSGRGVLPGGGDAPWRRPRGAGRTRQAFSAGSRRRGLASQRGVLGGLVAPAPAVGVGADGCECGCGWFAAAAAATDEESGATGAEGGRRGGGGGARGRRRRGG